MTSLEQAIMTPVVLFDLFDRPIRYNSLPQLAYGHTLTRAQLTTTYNRLELRNKLVRRGEFVALAGRGELFANAILRDQLSDELWVEATKRIRALGSVPYVRMIAVVNSLSFHNANANSDIDLLIVTEPGKISIARDHITVWLTYWRRRNTSGEKRGKLAADVFLDTDNLSVRSFHGDDQNLYIDYWAAWVAPVINRDKTYERFLKANPWIKQTFPGFEGHAKHIITVPKSLDVRRRWWEALYRNPFGHKVGSILTNWQNARLKRYQARVKDQGTVIVTPHLLRFHVPDRRVEYQHAFEEQWQRIND